MSRPARPRELLALDGKVALVTGAAGGIGSAVTKLFLDLGARVASVDLPGRPCMKGAFKIECDVADTAGVDTLFRSFSAEFDRLDILVHCAGIARDAVLWKMTDQAWRDVLRVNLDSAFMLLKRGVPLMRPLASGAVVLISSINGERGKFGQSNYAASKAGLIGLARTAARELGKFGIRVNVVAPGMIETPMTATLPDEVRRAAINEAVLAKLGQPEDVAWAVLFLVSPMSRHITGQVLRVDGGQLIA